MGKWSCIIQVAPTEARGSMSERRDVTTETLAAMEHFKNGHELRNSSGLERLETARNGFYPEPPEGGAQSCQHLDVILIHPMLGF